MLLLCETGVVSPVYGEGICLSIYLWVRGIFLQTEYVTDEPVKPVFTGVFTQLFAIWIKVGAGDSIFVFLEVSFQCWILLKTQ